jgi:hypothetical protein
LIQGRFPFGETMLDAALIAGTAEDMGKSMMIFFTIGERDIIPKTLYKSRLPPKLRPSV